MGFFLCDVHRQIEKLHQETTTVSVPFIVYRGQGISKIEFEQLKATKGGLLAFSSFLSTSVDRRLSILYAESAAQDLDLNGILFEISVDPTCTSTAFASLDNISYY
ncbi:unnamed protein product, partial [Adineta ricciae]